ncbi:Gfo/Idh/MocA family protein [Variovorax sp. Sphag1AA]|uniref:Gfo/Idh/MocA family protein n=1 Tax=Variovorax sp. Sphag1AA TaxID=2587027 RepID=UPI001608B40C|nr:Gfo/Idh/MocA family oxidoreductase [Variovorax sp. Sphag1AA]MBB3177165.1 putative dehydrogenase [Variovorax sp. Sphag1AA]
MNSEISSDSATEGKAELPLKVLIIGCGAVVEEYQGPAAREAERQGWLEVVGLVDRSEERLARCQSLFPSAKCYTDLDRAREADIALIATPARSHADLAISLLGRGYNLLVEKPICATAAEARTMRSEADRLGRMLAVGHFRRFFPAIETIRTMITSGVFGQVRRVVADEGGTFRWPAASAGFFTRQEGGGGVTLDIGIHMLEILVSWLGMPEVVDYADDAMGGVEINSAAKLRWPGGTEADIRLSWDVELANRYRVEFEKATVTWRTGQATDLVIEIDGVAIPQLATGRQQYGSTAEYSTPAHGYLGAFTAQWKDVVDAVRENRKPRVSGGTAMAALSLVETMYARKRLMDMPYFDPEESARAQQLVEAA